MQGLTVLYNAEDLEKSHHFVRHYIATIITAALTKATVFVTVI